MMKEDDVVVDDEAAAHPQSPQPLTDEQLKEISGGYVVDRAA